MQLLDRTGVIEARLWDDADEVFDQVKEGGPVKVAGAVETFREELQVNVRRLRVALPEELDIADFVRVTGRDPAAMWETVMQAVGGSKTLTWRRLCATSTPTRSGPPS
jgi:3'-5' exoribonuclease